MPSWTRIAAAVSLLIPIISGILTVILKGVQDFSMGIRPGVDLIPVGFALSLMVTDLLLISRIIPRYRSKRLRMMLRFLLYLASVAVASASWALMTVFHFVDSNLDFFWRSLPSFFLYSGIFFIMWFTLDLFYGGMDVKKNRMYLAVGALFVVALELLTTLTVIMEEVILFSIVSAAILSVAGVFATTLLAGAGFTASRRVLETEPNRSMHMIGFSGVALAAGFVLQIAFVAIYYGLTMNLPQILWFSWTFWILGSILLYFGFTLPMKD